MHAACPWLGENRRRIRSSINSFHIHHPCPVPMTRILEVIRKRLKGVVLGKFAELERIVDEDSD